MAIALGMKVSVYSESFSSRQKDYPNISSKSLSNIISDSDIISFHCKPPKDGKSLVSIDQLKLMKKNAVLINTARGGLINENDLKQALEEGLIRGAAIDVFTEEPAKENVLFGTKNLILTPHIAASTVEAQLASGHAASLSNSSSSPSTRRLMSIISVRCENASQIR